MQFSAAISILATIAVGVISNIHRNLRHGKALKTGEGTHDQRFRPVHVFEALENGGKGCISVAVACGIAGIICGCLTVTGLASTVINAIVTVSQGKLFLGLLLTMICCSRSPTARWFRVGRRAVCSGCSTIRCGPSRWVSSWNGWFTMTCGAKWLYLPICLAKMPTR
jgi:hypothetical protein